MHTCSMSEEPYDFTQGEFASQGMRSRKPAETRLPTAAPTD